MAQRRIEQSDLNAVQRGLNMIAKSRVQLQNIIDYHSGDPTFAARVLVQAAQQMIAAKRRLGLFARDS